MIQSGSSICAKCQWNSNSHCYFRDSLLLYTMVLHNTHFAKNCLWQRCLLWKLQGIRINRKQTICSFPNCWWLLCLCRQLLPSLTLLSSSEIQDIIENSGRAEGKENSKIKVTLRTWDTYETFSTAREKRPIVLEAINSGPKIIYFLTKICQGLSHFDSQMVHGNCLLLYVEEIVFKLR